MGQDFFPNSDTMRISVDVSKIDALTPSNDLVFLSISNPSNVILANTPILLPPFDQGLSNQLFPFSANSIDITSLNVCVDVSESPTTPICESPDSFPVDTTLHVLGNCLSVTDIPSLTEPPDINLDVPNFGVGGDGLDLTQPPPNYKNVDASQNQCGPMSFANAMQQLEDQNDEINIPYPHIPGLYDQSLVGILEKYMARGVPDPSDRRDSNAKGVFVENGLVGKLKFLIDNNLVELIETTVMDFYIDSDIVVHRGNVVLTAQSLGTKPTFEFIKDCFDAEGVVEMGYTHTTGAHATVITRAYEIFGNQYIKTLDDKNQSSDSSGTGRGSHLMWKLTDDDDDGLLNMSGPDREIFSVVCEKPGKFIPSLLVKTPIKDETTTTNVLVSGVAGFGDTVRIQIGDSVDVSIPINPDGTWSTTIPLVFSGGLNVEVTSIDTSTGESTPTVTIPFVAEEGEPPNIEIADPLDGDVFLPGTITFEAFATDKEDDDDVLNSKIIWSVNGIPEPSYNDGETLDKLLLSPGDYEVRATVFDSDDNVAEDAITITVITIQEKIENLIEKINQLDLNKGNKNSLIQKLNNILEKITNENPKDDKSACNKLRSFLPQLQGFNNSGKLDENEINEIVYDVLELKDNYCRDL
jgi:hypothetical protein